LNASVQNGVNFAAAIANRVAFLKSRHSIASQQSFCASSRFNASVRDSSLGGSPTAILKIRSTVLRRAMAIFTRLGWTVSFDDLRTRSEAAGISIGNQGRKAASAARTAQMITLTNAKLGVCAGGRNGGGTVSTRRSRIRDDNVSARITFAKMPDHSPEAVRFASLNHS
jgi:hypothetical protein